MARETKEERAANAARYQAKREADHLEYLKGVPKRLMDAQALAQKVGLDVTVTLTENGPSVRFRNGDNPYIDDSFTYQVEEWELEHLEGQIKILKAEQDAKEQRFRFAQDVWAKKLTEEEKAAIKEHIYLLR